MIQFKKAQELLINLAHQFSRETDVIPLDKADGRICSQDIISPEAVPSFHNSAMDGFAVRSEDTRGATKENPIRLPVLSLLAAGDDFKSYASGVHAIEIMTGAPLPEVFDAVVKIEDVETYRDEHGITIEVLISSFVPSGNNIREKGTDYQIGQKVLARGACIRAESMMALASLGIAEVCVFKKPVVAILSTGKELVPLETKALKSGMIRNSTAVYLKAAMNHIGAEVASVEIMGDEIENFKTHVKRSLNQDIDVLLTTGAVSMGKYDFIVPTLQEIGAEIIFHKVAIRPGKPILVAKIHRPNRNPLVIFGMPGNPISTTVGLRFFLTPFFRELNRQGLEQALQIRLAQTTAKPEGLKCFFKARLEHTENGLSVRSLTGQASFMVSPLVYANAWVLFSEDGNKVNEGENVFVYPLLPDQFFNSEVL